MPDSRIDSLNGRISFEQIGAFSTLFNHYIRFQSPLSSFFSADFRSDDNFRQQAKKTLTIPRDRSTLVDVLQKQNARWGLDSAVKANLDALAKDDAVVVITGQQLGLFLSPLYILYKTMTTLLLARRMQETLQQPVIPMFWLHGEDHDFSETSSATLLDSQYAPHTINYSPSTTPLTSYLLGPVGRMRFTDQVRSLLYNVEAVLPSTPNKKDLIAFLREHFQEGHSLMDAFAKLLKRVFPDSGLVLFSSDDPRIKHMCIPLFRKELQHPEELTRALETTTQKLQRTYHAQVQTRPTNLFLIDDTSRSSITAIGNGFQSKGLNHIASSDELLALLESSPERFSPNVLLRPIMQDAVLPTIAYVAGPGEIAYFAQYKSAYAWAGIPMPIIYPRASMTLIEPSIARKLDAYSFPFTWYKDDPNKVFRKFVLDQIPLNLDALSASATEFIDTAMEHLDAGASSIDSTLHRSAASTRVRMHQEVSRLVEKIVKAQKRKQDVDKRRFTEIHASLFPGQKLQERALSPLHFLNQYGLDFFSTLMDEVSLDTTSHQVIHL